MLKRAGYSPEGQAEHRLTAVGLKSPALLNLKGGGGRGKSRHVELTLTSHMLARNCPCVSLVITSEVLSLTIQSQS